MERLDRRVNIFRSYFRSYYVDKHIGHEPCRQRLGKSSKLSYKQVDLESARNTK